MKIDQGWKQAEILLRAMLNHVSGHQLNWRILKNLAEIFQEHHS